MKIDSIKRLKDIGSKLVNKSKELQELAKIIPEQSRKIKAYGEYYDYVSEEYSRLSSLGVDCDLMKVVDFQSIENSLSWNVPTNTQIYSMTTTLSGEATSIIQPMMPYVDGNPEEGFLQNPPESFTLLNATGESINQLDLLKYGLGANWRNAWDCLAVGDIKNAAVHARTTLDELSWLVPYDHLKKLNWCQFDDKDAPTRASRFAWILHGDTLPAEINNDPSNEYVWKKFGESYKALQKFIHITDIKQSDLLIIDIVMKALQEALEEYLIFGIQRLKKYV
jgi:hypothetical protein